MIKIIGTAVGVVILLAFLCMCLAKIIIRLNDRGVWKTESGRHGPWILVWR